MPTDKIDRGLALAVKYSFLILFFFLPLLMYRPASEVFEFPKMLFVYAMTTIIVGFWIIRMIFSGRIIFRRTPLDIPILLFLVSQIASTIYSIDPRVSWMGWYGRFHGGLWSTISYALLYYALVSNLSEHSENSDGQSVGKSDSQKTRLSGFLNLRFSEFSGYQSVPSVLIFAILASAAVVSLYALLQHFGIDKAFWVQDVVNRVFSTQGQPNWLAGYIVMVLPLLLAKAITREKGQGIRDKDQTNANSLSLWPLALSLLLFLVILFTKSRSGLLGFAVADAIFWGMTRHVKQFLLIHLVILSLILIVDNPARDFLRNSVLRPSPTKSELGGTESGDIRRLVWSGAIKLVKQRPLFGTGPETFAYTYWWVRPAEHNLTSEWNFLYNKAHNEWLNLAANTGIFGLGSHLLLLGWFAVWTLRTVNREQRAESRDSLTAYCLLLTALLSATLGVEVVNFFGFSTVTVGTYTYLYMAMAVATISDLKTHNSYVQKLDRATSSKLNMSSYFLLMSLVLAALYLLSRISIWFLADLSYNRGRLLAEAGYPLESLPKLEAAVELRPSEPTFRAQLAEIQSFLARQLFLAKAPDDQIKIFKDEARRNFQVAAGQSPFNLSLSRNRARATFALGEIDPALYQQGITLMKKALELAPTNPTLPLNLGMMYQSLGDKQTAAGYYQKALELKPDFEEAKNKILK